MLEEAVTGHPQTLAALSALQVDFPEFYGDLQDNPDLLDAFSRVFVDDASVGEQPTALHDILRSYRAADGDGPAEGADGTTDGNRTGSQDGRAGGAGPNANAVKPSSAPPPEGGWHPTCPT